MATQVVKAASFGGGGGSPFDDLAAAGGSVNAITKIVVRSGSYVDNISTTYAKTGGGTYVGTHGGGGGAASTINLASGEKIVGIKGRSGSFLDQVSFVVRGPGGQKVYGPYAARRRTVQLEAEIDLIGRRGTYVDASASTTNVNTTELRGAAAVPPSRYVPDTGKPHKQIVIRTLRNRRVTDTPMQRRHDGRRTAAAGARPRR